jgi:glutathione S-transferase
MLRLHFDPVSTTCRAVVLFAREEGLEMEYKPLSLLDEEHLRPEFVALNPNHAVPVLEHDGFVLTESSAILKYLADLTGSPAYPSDLRARARVNEAMDWFNTGFYRDFGHGYIYTQVIDVYHWPDAAQQHEALQRALSRAEEKLRILDAKLAATGAFVCGPTISLADYFGAGFVSLAYLVNFDLAPYAHVSAWLGRMQTLPAWAPTHEAFMGWCAAMQSPSLASGVLESPAV